MKEILTLLLTLILISSAVLADPQGMGQTGTGRETTPEANQSGEGTGQGQQVQTGQETQNIVEEENLTIRQREQTRAGNVSELGQMIQERQQEMNQQMQNLGETQQKVYQNQNRVRLAVHSLLAMEDLIGGIGNNVSQVAREFNNSVQATIRAEERIQTRNRLVRFFIGGDREAAENMEREVNQNRERIQELKRLREECDCGEEIKAMLQEQIQAMEQEQNRLQELAQNEKRAKGIFGWMFGWLRK